MIAVLLVDDSPSDARLMTELLKTPLAIVDNDASAGTYMIDWVQTLKTARERLLSRTYDVILLDIHLPDSEGLEGLEAVTQAAPTTPIILISGIEDEQLIGEAFEAGADFLGKREISPKGISRAIRRAIATTSATLGLPPLPEVLSSESLKRSLENLKDLKSALLARERAARARDTGAV